MLFELYNEPHDVSWRVWKSGGDAGDGCQAVGMQQLYDAVRATGAENLVIIGGLDWAYDLSGVPGEPHRRLQHPLRDPPLRRTAPSSAPSDVGRVLGIPDRDRSRDRDGVRRRRGDLPTATTAPS